MKEHLISQSPVAEETYLKTLSQILDRWTIKEAEDFEARVESLINRLKDAQLALFSVFFGYSQLMVGDYEPPIVDLHHQVIYHDRHTKTVPTPGYRDH